MKKFKFLCTVVAVVLAVGMFATTAMAASFTTTTTYTESGDAFVETVVSGITEEEVNSQVTYVAYKNGVVTTGDNILYIDQRAVASQDNITFSYSVPKAELKGVTQTTIGLGSSVAAPTAGNDKATTIDGHTVEVLDSENGTLSVNKSEVYYGNVVTVTITPADYYEIDKLVINNVETPVVSGNTYELTVEGDTTVKGIFKAIKTDITTDDVSSEVGSAVASLNKEDVETFLGGAQVENGPFNLPDIAVLNVKSVVAKLTGNPANFGNFEYGLKVTYADGSEDYFPANGCLDDGSFAVRLIDTTAEQNAFPEDASFTTYIK